MVGQHGTTEVSTIYPQFKLASARHGTSVSGTTLAYYDDLKPVLISPLQDGQ
jgi:hypothetical protein